EAAQREAEEGVTAVRVGLCAQWNSWRSRPSHRLLTNWASASLSGGRRQRFREV
ncbi:unnamed protein product, partial [Phaeothamnion confervicola]